MYILVFVSIERLIAVKRPHSFNMKAQRAKKAIIGMVVSAVVYTTVRTVAQLNKYGHFVRLADLSVLCVSVLVMTTCYTLISATMVKRAKTSRNCIAVVNLTDSSEPGPSHGFQQRNVTATTEDLVCEHNPEPSNKTDTNRVEPKITRQCDEVVPPENAGSLRVSMVVKETLHEQCGPTAIASQTTSKPDSSNNQTAAIKTKTYKNLLLLFIITVLFIVFWLPHWVANLGVSIPEELRRIFMLNSVVNPFIYGIASAMFREDVRQFYRQKRVKLRTCFH
ncbi:hypothetical protein LSAT2_027658 [Lamellibrachia satsuma]|nr:hypothetical protein LSAT2_027658 [Lamellibrachia satsuma]